MPQKDDGHTGATTPVGLPLSQGPQTHGNSVWYLYSAPGTSYSQLMVAARKAESENEETQEKVRARAAVTSNPGEGTAELGQQIAKLMAALTQTGQGSSPSSAPGSPWEHDHGWGHHGRSTQVTQTPAMSGVTLARHFQPAAYPKNGGRGHREPDQ